MPSAGPTTFAPARARLRPRLLQHVRSFHRTVVSRQCSGVRPMCQYSLDSHDRPKAPIPDEEARRARGGHAPAHHRERRRAPRHGRPRAHVGQRAGRARRRAPVDRLPPLPRRGRRSSRPAPRTGRPRTRCPTSAPGPAIEDPDERLRAALGALYPYYRRTARMMENLIRDEPVSELVREHFAAYHGYIAAAREALLRGRARAGPRAHARARRDRPRAGLHHVALARARRGPRRRPGGRADGAPGGRLAMAASAPARLITIPISHFCEKARWALDRAGIAYREERHIQVIHRVASRRAGGGGTVPVLGHARGRLRAVGRHPRLRRPPRRAGCTPRTRRCARRWSALERDFDADLGPEGRRWIYFHILPAARPRPRYNCPGVPAWERRAFPLLLGAMSGYIRHLFAIGPETDDAGRRGGAADLRRGRRAAGDGRRYLCGDAFTGRRPGLRRAGRARPPAAPVRRCAPAARRAAARHGRGVRAFRAHPAGAFALRLFARGALISGRRRP